MDRQSFVWKVAGAAGEGSSREGIARGGEAAAALGHRAPALGKARAHGDIAGAQRKGSILHRHGEGNSGAAGGGAIHRHIGGI